MNTTLARSLAIATAAARTSAPAAWGHAAVKSYSPRAGTTVPRSVSR